jgi:hypothetical protein
MFEVFRTLKIPEVKHGRTNIQHSTSNIEWRRGDGKPGKATQGHTLAKAEMLKAETAESGAYGKFTWRLVCTWI